MNDSIGEGSWRLKIEARLSALQLTVSSLAISIGSREAVADALARAEEAVRRTVQSEFDELLMDALAQIRTELVEGPES
jgi:hypothetical protein